MRNKKFTLKICSVRAFFDITKRKNLEDTAAILCSSYPFDDERCNSLKNKLCLAFDDVTNDNLPNAFSLVYARKIRDFIDGLDKTVKTIYVCCDSGESRSTALGAAIMRYIKKSDREIWLNPLYHPNPLVYELQCRAFGVFVTRFGIKNRVEKNKNALKKHIKKQRRKPQL